MKWFQHQTNMFETDYGAYIRSKYRLAGYARWCILLELIASSIDKDNRDKCSRTLPIKEWCKHLEIRHEKFIDFLKDLKEKVGINFEVIEEKNDNFKKLLKVTISQLEDWCDNHTKNTTSKNQDLQVTNKQELELELKSELKLNPELDIEKNNLVELKLNQSLNSKEYLELEEQVNKVFEFYKYTFDRPKYQLTEKRKKKIKARLSEAPTDTIPWVNNRFLELLVAITEVSLTDFNMGKNDQQKTYIELDEHCCRNQEQVEQRLNQALERGNLEKIKKYLTKESYLNEEITG